MGHFYNEIYFNCGLQKCNTVPHCVAYAMKATDHVWAQTAIWRTCPVAPLPGMHTTSAARRAGGHAGGQVRDSPLALLALLTGRPCAHSEEVEPRRLHVGREHAVELRRRSLPPRWQGLGRKLGLRLGCEWRRRPKLRRLESRARGNRSDGHDQVADLETHRSPQARHAPATAFVCKSRRASTASDCAVRDHNYRTAKSDLAHSEVAGSECVGRHHARSPVVRSTDVDTSACSNHEMPCTQMQFTEYCNKIPCSVLSVGSKPGLVNDFFRARNQQSQHARIFSHANLHPYGCCAPSGGILRVPGLFRNFSILPKKSVYND